MGAELLGQSSNFPTINYLLGATAMNRAAKSTAVQFILFLFLFAIAATIRAEHDHTGGTGTINDEVHILTAPARMILDHNKWLLNGTTIGSTLSRSSNTKAQGLYQQAHRLYRKAETSLESGEENLARDLAHQSIQSLYESDRQHYNLAAK